ncbi:uncharacterized protein LOC129971293 [Argiope bruennichi]|uniref:uncharacterized protein LOC129971293 n=1 Tax=Argiope bruennichi TaxID=94029 RepID=UPI0024958ACC|nr:uncharacterized protein LOC129971293 [Argiope bruennichi]
MGPKNLNQQTTRKNTEKYYDHFFVIKRLSEDKETFHTVSPFLVEKAVSGTLGEVSAIRKLRSGDLLVEVNSRKQSNQILKLKALATIPISVSAHTSLNSSKGVITCGELFHTSIEEITNDLKPEGVIHVRRISIRRDGQLLPTKHLVLTFQMPTLPEVVKIGYMRLKVRPFIPNPLRCFQCQRFGHPKIACRGTLTCARCAEKGHDSQQCTSSEKCVNCDGEHTSFSRSCPRWRLEKEIITLKTKEQISYPEAKRRIEAQTPSPGVSYASAVKKSYCKNCSCKNCVQIVAEKVPPAKTSESDTEPSTNSAPESHDPPKRKPKPKPPRALKLKLSKHGLSQEMISEKFKSKFKKSNIRNSVALGLATTGTVQKDLPTIFGGLSKSPDSIALHPSDEEEDDLEMSCEITPTQTNALYNSQAKKLS